MKLLVSNTLLTQVGDFAIQFNKNSFGITPATPLQCPALGPNQSETTVLPLNTNGQVQKMAPLNTLQVAIKTSNGVCYWAAPMPIHIFFVMDGKMESSLFVNTWKEIPQTNEKSYDISGWNNTDLMSQKLLANNIFMITSRNIDGQEMVYFSMKLTNQLSILVEVKCPGRITVKCRVPDVCDLVHESIQEIISS